MAISDETMLRWEREREYLRHRRENQDLYRMHFNTVTEEQVAQTVTTSKVKLPVSNEATTEPKQKMEKIVTCVPHVTLDPMTVLVVGAGGNGARIIPPLTQMLRRRDRLFIMDHDIVEDRNLTRQHFTERDIGQPKALVLAQRYQKRDLKPVALVARLTAGGVAGIIQGMDFTAPRNHLVILGCVDNNDARKIMSQVISGSVGLPARITGVAHIDVGNERRGGKVLMSLKSWPMTATEGSAPPLGLGVRNYSMFTMSDAMPQLMKPTPWMCDDCAIQMPPTATACSKCGREQGTCGNRIDMQTVMVNHMASGMGDRKSTRTNS